mgnify:CR=1 FL=1
MAVHSMYKEDIANKILREKELPASEPICLWYHAHFVFWFDLLLCGHGIAS